jgi:hypothetical protein
LIRGWTVLSSAGQGGEFHVNEQPYEYWRTKFTARGYAVFDCARRPVMGLKEIEPWYRFNTFLFANEHGQSRLSDSARRDIVEASRPLEILAPWQWRMHCYVRSRLLSPFASGLARATHRLANAAASKGLRK